MNDRRIEQLARDVIERATAAGLKIATAESCTGGLVAGALTEIPGSSAVFTHGFVTYANEAKAEVLSVDDALLARHGAVSAEVVRAMATGALARSGADLAVATTGIAGPGGGTASKPVGLVYFGIAGYRSVGIVRRVFPAGGRSFIRERSVLTALQLLSAALQASAQG
jgi:nicotinamide-nucleotide amidase